ncbi:MAG: transcription antitermination factor NusB, partial [Oscillospiraceae bacterium]|nr:transcription antitermination factor NusB [Oscillospiraceae bacterium]
MSRRQEREAIFLLLFEKCFNLQDELELIIENAQDARDFKSNPNILTKTKAILENSSKLDEFIEKHLKNWTKNRISKVALCVLRIAVFEILN